MGDLDSISMNMESAIRELPGVLANCTDQISLLAAMRVIDGYCEQLAALRITHAQNLCRVANHLQYGSEGRWGHHPGSS